LEAKVLGGSAEVGALGFGWTGVSLRESKTRHKAQVAIWPARAVSARVNSTVNDDEACILATEVDAPPSDAQLAWDL